MPNVIVEVGGRRYAREDVAASLRGDAEGREEAGARDREKETEEIG